jgi:hypothetical protein
VDIFDLNDPMVAKATAEASEFYDYIHSAEHRLNAKLRTFDMSLEIFDGNFAELLKGVERSMPFDRDGILPWVLEVDQRNDKQTEATRALHNFLASASALIDHARKFYREMYETDLRMPDYQSRIEEAFVNDGLSQFIVGLRQYAVHYQSLMINFTVSLDNIKNTMSSNASLKRESLLGYGGWKPIAKQFIKASPEAIELVAVCSQYHDKVRGFYAWFKSEQERIHKDALEYIDRMEKKYTQPPEKSRNSCQAGITG